MKLQRRHAGAADSRIMVPYRSKVVGMVLAVPIGKQMVESCCRLAFRNQQINVMKIAAAGVSSINTAKEVR